MQTQTQKTEFCKKLKFGERKNPTIVFGIILSEDQNFLVFKTAKREYKVNQSLVLSLEDTNILFKNGGGNDRGI